MLKAARVKVGDYVRIVAHPWGSEGCYGYYIGGTYRVVEFNGKGKPRIQPKGPGTGVVYLEEEEYEVVERTSPIKLALIGPMRAGKDEVAYRLKANYGIESHSFAGRMKTVYYTLFGGSDAQKDRAGLVWFGETMRERDPDVWIRLLFDALDAVDDAGDHVITDVRRPQEYEFLKARGYKFVRIRASFETRRQRAEACGDNFDPADMYAPSEVDQFDFEHDYVIDNNTNSPADLVAEIAKFWEAYISDENGSR